jgi:BirA family biotin operon repressor/biotin-[acetyl-CoA-carboxylase] ligase
MRIEIIDSCPSTNAAIAADAPHGYALMAREQTAGRGQRGNSWEAAPGENITLSLMLRPEAIPAARQFEVSEAVALGVVDLLDSLGIADVAVKWPNDIYVADRKVCGILIENSLSGTAIARSIAGIGLNVNQLTWRSDAPNPVSIAQLTGRTHSTAALAARMCGNILRRLSMANHDEYRRRLWRGTGVWPWRTASGEIFRAAIDDVLPDGHIIIASRAFAFKEVFPLSAQ